MTELFLLAVLPLTFAQAAGSETLIAVVPAEGWERWVALLASIATILIALALIAIAFALIAAAWQSRKIYGRVHTLLDRLHDDVRPIVSHATDVAENVNYMSTAIRSDVEDLRGTLNAAQQRLTRAAGTTEERIRQFNALIKVVQEEAEELFIDTASTLRGVQVGARTLRGESENGIDWELIEQHDEPMAGRSTRRRRTT